MSDTTSFDSLNIKDELNIFSLDNAKFVKKFTKNGELQESFQSFSKKISVKID